MALLSRLAPPGVTVLVLFLAFTSQWLFHYLEPGSIPKTDAYIFNALVACLLICYYRTCTTDPGRIPKDWHENAAKEDESLEDVSTPQRHRWCRKCEAFKPPRAHHCKTCRRCVMKMDHHCVWTANCVSHITLPHFIRFLSYAVAAMLYLEYFLYIRVAVLWRKRHLPSYLGPNVFQLAHIFVLVTSNSMVLFALILLLGRSIWSLALNMTTIESWEVERHHTVLRRARALGGFIYGPDGTKVRIVHQEFPWDIGIWKNFCKGMGSQNPLAWLWPFSASPSVASGLVFEHNEIDDPSKPWPPPDPDRMLRAANRGPLEGSGFTQAIDVESFLKRQEADRSRRHEDADGDYVIRRRPFHERMEHMARDRGPYQDDEAATTDEEEDDDDDRHDNDILGNSADDGGEEAWRNREGERLADFGVDEVVDFYDEDDLPLSELMRRRTKTKAP
ncbi:Palmitoyltransferase pfa4 [Acrodontium crateriforme]|uniref:Palmitoyltransferase PFA4 n=1 Tax=Acrodontium crateriforme TaxID=150365 RepID=A0AAQ3R910_9PEZI|nr:Palmitoyltransferase pfa4 [Acrodontium crateriforme]